MLRTRRSPWLIALAVAVLGGALFATYVAFVWRWVDCNIGGSVPCVPASKWQVYAAAAGIPFAALCMIESLRKAGRPLVWVAVTIAAYAVWGAVAYAAFAR